MPSPLSPTGAGVPFHSPLDAESQYNSIVTLQGLLALVCGTGIPHLTGNLSQMLLLGIRAGCQQSHKTEETGCHLGTCLPGSRAEISLCRKGNVLQRVGLKSARHGTAAHISPFQPCRSHPRPAPHTEPEQHLPAPAFDTLSRGSSTAAEVFPLSTHCSQEREHGDAAPIAARTGDKGVFLQ